MSSPIPCACTLFVAFTSATRVVKRELNFFNFSLTLYSSPTSSIFIKPKNRLKRKTDILRRRHDRSIRFQALLATSFETVPITDSSYTFKNLGSKDKSRFKKMIIRRRDPER